jgi:SAM-dependent methyltransferase
MSGPEEGQYWDGIYGQVQLDVVRKSLAAPGCHPVYNPVGEYSFREEVFGSWIASVKTKSALVVGAGVDKIGIRLATAGCQVTSLDLSQEAVKLTAGLAAAAGVAERMHCVCADWEQADLGQTYDLVVFHDSLHHMRLEPALAQIDRHLSQSGVLLALEPICPLPWVRRLHGRFPFHPFPFLATERELDFADLRRIEALFGRVECKFFDLVTRESISVLLFRLGIRQTITRLGSLDAFLLRHIPGLKGLASYVILRATRA